MNIRQPSPASLTHPTLVLGGLHKNEITNPNDEIVLPKYPKVTKQPVKVSKANPVPGQSHSLAQ